MKLSTKLALSLLLVRCSIAARGETLDHMKELWRAKKYEQVIPLLLAFRNQPGGRTWPVDYQVPGCEEKTGAGVFRLAGWAVLTGLRKDTLG